MAERGPRKYGSWLLRRQILGRPALPLAIERIEQGGAAGHQKVQGDSTPEPGGAAIVRLHAHHRCGEHIRQKAQHAAQQILGKGHAGVAQVEAHHITGQDAHDADEKGEEELVAAAHLPQLPQTGVLLLQLLRHIGAGTAADEIGDGKGDGGTQSRHQNGDRQGKENAADRIQQQDRQRQREAFERVEQQKKERGQKRKLRRIAQHRVNGQIIPAQPEPEQGSGHAQQGQAAEKETAKAFEWTFLFRHGNLLQRSQNSIARTTQSTSRAVSHKN